MKERLALLGIFISSIFILASTAYAYSQLVSIPGKALAACYPYVVTDKGVYNLLLGKYVAVFDDPGLRAACVNGTIAVASAHSVYIYYNGRMAAIPFDKQPEIIGVAPGGSVGILAGGKAVVLTPSGSIAIDVPAGARHLSYYMINGVPVVSYVLRDGNRETLYVAAPGYIVKVSTSYPAIHAAGFTSDGYLVVYTDSFHAYRLRVINGTIVANEDDALSTYVPYVVTSFTGDTSHLIATTDVGDALLVDLHTHRWIYLGRGETTPIGVYNQYANYTSVYLDGSLLQVPGRAVGVIGDIVVTSQISNKTYVTYLYPVHKTVLVLSIPFKGYLVTHGYAIRVALRPGVHYLPLNSTLMTQDGAIYINKVFMHYPPQPQPHISSTINVRYKVIPLPAKAYHITLRHVSYVDSGDGFILAIRGSEADIYSVSGLVSRIPGTWLFGGVSKSYVALYDGAMLHIYTIAGDPVKSYAVILPHNKPVHVLVSRNGVAVYYSNKVIKVSDRGVSEQYTTTINYGDIKVKVSSGNYSEIIYGNFKYYVPASSVHANGLYTAWSINRTWYVLSIPDSVIYVLTNATPAEVYPMNGYIAAITNGTLRIYPIVSWFSKCYVKIIAPKNATVYVNGNQVGSGNVTYYAQCGSKVNVTVLMPYHNPFTKTVRVKPGGVVIHAKPVPLVARVKVVIQQPGKLNISAAILRIDGKLVTVPSNGTISLLAGKPYTIEVVGFKPYDVCAHLRIVKTFHVGDNVLQIPCRIRGAVLGLVSDVDSLVRIITSSNMTLFTVHLVPRKLTLLTLSPGTYKLRVEPQQPGYMPRTVNVTLANNTVTIINVTPAAYGRLVVSVTPPTGTIQVLSVNGTPVAGGTGKVDTRLPPGTYQVVIAAPGFQSVTKIVNVTAGKTTKVEVALTPVISKPVKKKQSLMERPELRIGMVVVVAAAAVIALWYRRRKEMTGVSEQ